MKLTTILLSIALLYLKGTAFADVGSEQPIAAFRFQSKNFPGHSMGIKNGNQAFIVPGDGERFILISPGLTGAAGTVSFQSVKNPNLYLRHAGYVMWSHPYLDQTLYKNDATFKVYPNKYFPGFTAFESVNFPNHYIRHQGYRLRISTGSSTLFKNDASFNVLAGLPIASLYQYSPPSVFKAMNESYSIGIRHGNQGYINFYGVDRFVLVSPGLSGHPGSVSFQSVSKPHYYLRHRGYFIYQDIYSNADLYKVDASFYPRESEFFFGYTAFESVNFPQYYIRHENYRLRISSYLNSDQYKRDASFQAPTVRDQYRQRIGPFQFPSQNFPAFAIGIKNINQGFIIAGSGEKYYLVTPGLSGETGSMSFESATKPGHYLRHSGFLIFLNPYSNTGIYKQDATFFPRNNKYFNAFAAFESSNYANRYIRHQGYRLKLHPDDGSDLMHKDASYMIKASFPLQPMTRQNGPYFIKSYNFPLFDMGIKFGHQGFIVNTYQYQFNILSPGLCGVQGTISFQLYNNLNKFFRYTNSFLIDAVDYVDSVEYKKAACFYPRYHKFFNGFTAYESYNYPSRYIRHQGYRLKLHSGSTELFKKDASFREV